MVARPTKHKTLDFRNYVHKHPYSPSMLKTGKKTDKMVISAEITNILFFRKMPFIFLDANISLDHTKYRNRKRD